MKRFVLLGGVVVFAVLLNACQLADAPKENENSVMVTGVTVESPVQPPASAEPTYEPYVFRTSEPDKATLKGRLLVHSPWSLIPDPDDAIFLVPLVDNMNISAIPEFTVGQVPQADVDERFGDFVFTNIMPGRYAVVVMTPSGVQIPATQDDGSVVILTINEADLNTTIDLGKLNFP